MANVVGQLKTYSITVAFVLVLQATKAAVAASPYPDSSAITGISFNWATHQEMAPGSDNWPVTWADNNHQYSSWGDGGGGESGKRYDIRYQNGKVYFVIDDNTTKTYLYSPNAVWGSGEWFHVVAIRNRATDRLYLYRDGQPDYDTADNTNNSIDSPGEPLLIGSGEEGEEHFPGAIDDIRFYNYVLSADDIDDLYNAGPGLAVTPANFNDDEIVDFRDLKIFLDDWLKIGY